MTRILSSVLERISLLVLPARALPAFKLGMSRALYATGIVREVAPFMPSSESFWRGETVDE